MKNLGKITAYIISAVMIVVFALGVILSFVPFSIGKKDYESFVGSLSLSQEVASGITAEYTITGEHSAEEIENSIIVMTDIISEYGFKSVNVYQKGADKIRVDINSTVLKENKSEAESLLNTLASGKLEIKDKNDANATSEECILIDGSKHIDKITKISSRGATGTISGLQIDFTKEGKELYSSATGSKLYMFVGGKAWPGDNTSNEIAANTDPSSTSLYLMFNAQDVVDDYYYVLKSGTMGISLDSENVQIAEISSPASTISGIVLLIIAIVVEVIFVTLLLLKHKGLALGGVISSLMAFMVLLFLMQAMDWVVVGRATLVVLILLEILAYAIISKQCNQIKEEYNIGKSKETAVIDGFKKTSVLVLEVLSALVILSITLSAVMGGEARAIGTVVACGSVLFALALLLLNRLFINVLYTLFPKSTKLFGLQAREEE